MVNATIVMAHAPGMLTVAEGIETPEQLELLTDMGCDIGQGYHFARPLPATDAITHLAPDGTWQPATAAAVRRHPGTRALSTRHRAGSQMISQRLPSGSAT